MLYHSSLRATALITIIMAQLEYYCSFASWLFVHVCHVHSLLFFHTVNIYLLLLLFQLISQILVSPLPLMEYLLQGSCFAKNQHQKQENHLVEQPRLMHRISQEACWWNHEDWLSPPYLKRDNNNENDTFLIITIMIIELCGKVDGFLTSL